MFENGFHGHDGEQVVEDREADGLPVVVYVFVVLAHTGQFVLFCVFSCSSQFFCIFCWLVSIFSIFLGGVVFFHFFVFSSCH